MSCSKENPLISIVVPNKNGIKYIRECLDSIVSQDYTEKEVIVVDGYSADGSYEVAESYRGVMVIRARPRGESCAINTGMMIANGDILTFLDSDDFYPPHALKEVARYFATQDVAWAYGLGKVVDGDGVETRKLMMCAKTFLMQHYNYNVLKIVDFLLQPAIYWRRSLYNEIDVFNGNLKYTFEYDWWLRAGKRYRPGFIKSDIGRWRMHGGSVTSGDLAQNAKEALSVQQKYNHNPIIWLSQYCSYLMTRAIYAREKRK